MKKILILLTIYSSGLLSQDFNHESSKIKRDSLQKESPVMRPTVICVGLFSEFGWNPLANAGLQILYLDKFSLNLSYAYDKDDKNDPKNKYFLVERKNIILQSSLAFDYRYSQIKKIGFHFEAGWFLQILPVKYVDTISNKYTPTKITKVNDTYLYNGPSFGTGLNYFINDYVVLTSKLSYRFPLKKEQKFYTIWDDVTHSSSLHGYSGFGLNLGILIHIPVSYR